MIDLDSQIPEPKNSAKEERLLAWGCVGVLMVVYIALSYYGIRHCNLNNGIAIMGFCALTLLSVVWVGIHYHLSQIDWKLHQLNERLAHFERQENIGIHSDTTDVPD
jgi:hypothetical protein